MSARKLVKAMGERRRSAFELRGALTNSSGSVASQLFGRYRRSSLQDDARKQHGVLLELAKPHRRPEHDGNGEQEGADELGKCSHRSSISTVNEEDESAVAAAIAAVFDEDDGNTMPILDDEPTESPDVDAGDDLAAEAEDCLMPLPSEAAHVFCDVDQCPPPTTEQPPPTPTPPTSTSTSQPGPMTLVPRRRKFGTVLREQPQHELFLFREEAEYSDYVDARVTGVHAEMNAVVYYQLDVHLSQMKWQVLRRFSEFRALRQRLISHLSRRQRFQTTRKCMICADILQTLEQAPFPSRRQQTPWISLLGGTLAARKHAVRSAAIVADRKRKLQGFVTTCLLTVRGLRQHSRLMCDSSACEISVALRMIEEFLGLSFTQYMRFLNERGVLDTREDKGHQARHTTGRRVRLHADSEATRRATMAV